MTTLCNAVTEKKVSADQKKPQSCHLAVNVKYRIILLNSLRSAVVAWPGLVVARWSWST